MQQLVHTFGETEENIWISKPACRNRRWRKASIQRISPSIPLGKDHVLLFDFQSKKGTILVGIISLSATIFDNCSKNLCP